MKLKLTTVYENVDLEWLQWWLRECGPMYGINQKQKPPLPHSITSKDPTSDVVGTTKIELIEEEKRT